MQIFKNNFNITPIYSRNNNKKYFHAMAPKNDLINTPESDILIKIYDNLTGPLWQTSDEVVL
jgi:hypothetical protein